MSKLFILGAGFSSAFFLRMPTMTALGMHILTEIPHLLPQHSNRHTLYRNLITKPGGIENLLSYLSQAIPWKESPERHMDTAALIKMLPSIAEYIMQCEEEAFAASSRGAWATEFVKYLHENKSPVATFNYDTVLERLLNCANGSATHTGDLYYKTPVIDLTLRTAGGGYIAQPGETFTLLKLHGSINWYFAGTENVSSQTVYYIPVEKMSPKGDYEGDSILERGKIGLTPLIIPPVTEKTAFYNIDLIKVLWTQLREELRKSVDEVYCVGYSLPKTDVTTSLFFSTEIDRRNRKVYIVNTDPRVRNNYTDLLNESEVEEKYMHELSSNGSPIEKMVRDLVG